MIRVPSAKTLAKYGWVAADFDACVATQGGVCPICENSLHDTAVNIDHFHAHRWKQMPSERRRLYVRGVIHWFCNRHYLGRSITVRRARNVVDYLEAFEERLKAIG